MSEGRAGSPRFYEILSELADLHERKNADYADKQEPLGNFFRVASIARPLLNEEGIMGTMPRSLHPVAIALLYKLKQTDATIEMLSKNKTAKAEGVTERFMDEAVYSILERVLLEDIRNPIERLIPRLRK